MAKILVFGTGAIGSIYASILCQAGVSVTCVCRSNYNAVKSNGLRIVSSIFGELQTRPVVVKSVHEALSASEIPFDFVLVCTKATLLATSSAIEAIKPAIQRPTTAIVVIQNGLGVERPYQQAFPSVTIISGVTYLPTTQTSPGVFSHSEIELLYLGLYPAPTPASIGDSSTSTPESTVLLRSFSKFLQDGGATVVVSEDIQAQRWTKILANAALNPICALSRCRDRQLIENSSLAGTVLHEVMFEIAAVGVATGYGDVVSPELVRKQFSRTMSRPSPGVEPSMMADALAGRPMEVEAILGEIVRLAQCKGIEIPRLKLLLVLLEGLNHSFQALPSSNVHKA